MKYYSTILNKLFDSIPELEKAEIEQKNKEKIAAEKEAKLKAEKEAKEKKKKEEAQKIEKMIKETTEAINKYVKQYGDISFSSPKDYLLFPYSSGFFDILSELFK